MAALRADPAGGSLETINAKLKQLKLPKVKSADEDLPQPQLSLLWVPQTEGTPNVAANLPSPYWPGEPYVDWVRTDFYRPLSCVREARSLLRAVPGQAVRVRRVVNGGRRQPGLRQAGLRLVNAHKHVKMLVYNQGADPNGPFR